MAIDQQQTSATLGTPSPLQNRSVSLGVPFLMRSKKLHRLLLTVPDAVDRVVVADNGPEDVDRTRWLDGDYPFDLEVLDLGVDVGIGACRNAIVEATTSDYLVVADSDMALPSNLGALMTVLDHHPELGAVSGVLSEQGQLRAGVTDFHEDDLLRGKTALVQSIDEEKDVTWESGHPVAKFDKLPNAMLVRRECISDYGWDETLKDKEHLDFFVGHWQESNWEFGVCPDVIFRHYTDEEDSEYYQEYRHGNDERQSTWSDTFRQKWDYDRVLWGDNRWFATGSRPTAERLWKALAPALPMRYSHPIKRVVERVIE